ncbi:MAG: kynureninase, partial [Gemmatimonadetes bacterium]|nr:kynureninase [Gemmatimonadota bacterium]
DSKVRYGAGHERFAGATYDPTSHYRAAAVFGFFEELNLTPALLREVSQHQIELLARSFDALDADPQIITRDTSVSLDAIGGFLALHSKRAEEISRLLRERGVATDYRGDILRFGPAPYLSDSQLSGAMDILKEVLQAIS